MAPRANHLRARAAALALAAPLLALLPGQGGDGPSGEEGGAVAFPLDRGPLDHLGWGTLEDVFVDVGGGAAVSALSGNLLLSVRPFPQADVPPDSQFALTYNHLDAYGSPELGPGWSWDLGRRFQAGPWGERILVDADGFRDAFWAGPPPEEGKLRRVLDDVATRWRRRSPRAQQRAAGGEDAFREAVVADPLLFAEMRVRFLGPPPQPEEGATLRSSRRTERSFTPSEDRREQYLSRPDGGRDVFDDAGRLLRVEPGIGPKVGIARDSGRLAGIDVAGLRRFSVLLDSLDRVSAVRSVAGAETRFEHVGARLRRITGPAGTFRFDSDDDGRLIGVDTPDGRLQIAYSADSGRVADVRGPRGRLTLSDLDGAGPGRPVEATVEGPDGSLRVRWSPDSHERVVLAGAGSSARVRFDPARPLPVQVSVPEGDFRFSWDSGGRLLEAARGERAARWERSADGGGLRALLGADGERAAVLLGEDGRPRGWDDPAGRRTTLDLDAFGLPRSIERPGGLRQSFQRNSEGSLRGAEASSGPSYALSRDERGFPRAIEALGAGAAALRLDDAARLLEFESPWGLFARMQWGEDGRLVALSDGASELRLDYDDAGRLVAWAGPAGRAALSRDAAGRLIAWSGDSGAAPSELARDSAGRPLSLLSSPGKTRRFGWSEDGIPLRWDRAPGVSVEVSRDSGGDIAAMLDSALGTLEVERDRGGRVLSVRRGFGTWSFDRDDSGRITRIGEPEGASTSLLLDPAGRPLGVSAPRGLRWRLSWDAWGRLVELLSRGARWRVERGPRGRVASFSDPTGRVVSIDRDNLGRARALRVPEEAAPVEIGWGPWGPLRVGERRIEWDAAGRPAGGDAPETEAESLQVPEIHADSRDPAGRVRAWTNASGDRALVDRDEFGDVRRLEVQAAGSASAVAWLVDRDGAGRVRSIRREGPAAADAAGARWDLLRDEAGRVRRWELGERFAVEFDALDAPPPGDSAVLAASLGIEVDDGVPHGQPAASRRVRVRDGGTGPTLLERDEIRLQDGGLRGAAAGSTPERPAESRLAWGAAPLVASDAQPSLPAPDGAGIGSTAAGWTRIAAGDGGTLLWLGPAARRLGVPRGGRGGAGPGRHGTPGGGAGPLQLGALAGPAAAVAAWWSGLAGDEQAGIAALLPPVPGARRLVPSAPGVELVDPLEMLSLSGDLPPAAAAVAALFDAPVAAWTPAVPGAALLRDVAARRAWPALPPGSADREAFSALAPDLSGLSTPRGVAARSRAPFALLPLVEGLPPGAEDLLPGGPAFATDPALRPQSWASLPSLARASALEALSDDPTRPGEAQRAVAASDETLGLLRSLVPHSLGALSGWLEPPRDGESWRIETPAGIAAVVDARGRLLSLDVQGRLRGAWEKRLQSEAGLALLSAALGEARPPDPAALLPGVFGLARPAPPPPGTPLPPDL